MGADTPPAHEPRDAFAAVRSPTGEQLALDARRPVAPAVRAMKRGDLPGQLCVGSLGAARCQAW
jgi:hypothetical protein